MKRSPKEEYSALWNRLVYHSIMSSVTIRNGRHQNQLFVFRADIKDIDMSVILKVKREIVNQGFSVKDTHAKLEISCLMDRDTNRGEGFKLFRSKFLTHFQAYALGATL